MGQDQVQSGLFISAFAWVQHKGKGQLFHQTVLRELDILPCTMYKTQLKMDSINKRSPNSQTSKKEH